VIIIAVGVGIPPPRPQPDRRSTPGNGRSACWPMGSAALSARPVLAVNVHGPGTSQALYLPQPSHTAGGAAHHAQPEKAGKRTDLLPALGPPAVLSRPREHGGKRAICDR